MMKLFYGVVILITVASCMTYQQMPENWPIIMSEWKGQPEDQVYLIYGAPSRSQTLEDGRKIITYDYAGSYDGDAYNADITFGITNKEVTTAKYNGSVSLLRDKIKAPSDDPIID
ncbi:hypothetical protein M8998_07455 [Sphingobacterium sp. lm-10]|uniref:hypothetical protein n=1 Tax=Sphingobacterium sp. lm-10 TaxID=2944904 RepID=UPI0020200C15|nr:hypothetical protein [Sphingobacterium sp. lm-10]MCL7987771.1 hypothetical protein [Sphingobacterium sp. lm-10]